MPFRPLITDPHLKTTPRKLAGKRFLQSGSGAAVLLIEIMLIPVKFWLRAYKRNTYRMAASPYPLYAALSSSDGAIILHRLLQDHTLNLACCDVIAHGGTSSRDCKVGCSVVVFWGVGAPTRVSSSGVL